MSRGSRFVLLLAAIAVYTVAAFRLSRGFARGANQFGIATASATRSLVRQWGVSVLGRNAPVALSSARADAGPSVGQSVLGRVDDSDDQTVSFVLDGGKKALLSTRSLSWQERMTLQVGAVMQLHVSKVAGSSVYVSLQPPSPSSVAQGLADGPASALRKLESQKRRPSANKGSGAFDPNCVLLNNLKTGMKLSGSVHSCTPYAAFIVAGVQRAAKGGQFKVEHGMLHKSDIPKSMLAKGVGFGKPLLPAGTPVTVYVKEVYKNSGRFTVTMDPHTEKAQVVEQKMQSREEGKERRRARRMRRVLETVTVGDTVTGVVDSIVPEGVLVKISSLGPLSVTGLLMKRDLPGQFTVPPDLKESFQAQLLAQDFTPGRQVTCCVLAVNTRPTADAAEFNMKLLFEDFAGAAPVDDLVINDNLDSLKKKGSKAKLPKGMVLDSEDEDDDEDGDDEEDDGELQMASDADVREIYDELRGNKPLMLAEDLYAWADIQDMIAEKEVTDEDIKKAMKEVKIPASKEIKFRQFQEIVEILQDVLDGSREALKAYDEDEQEDDEESSLSEAEIAALPSLPPKLVPVVAAAAKPKPAPAPAPAAKKKEEEVDEEGAPVSLDEEKVDDLEDEAIEEVAQEIYDELRGKSKSLSVKSFKAWSDIKDLQSSGLIDDESIKEALQDVGATKDLSFEQFFEVVQILEDVAAEKGEGDADADDDADDEDDDDEYVEIDEAAEEELLKEEFEKLQNKSGKVTVSALKKWEELVSMGIPAEDIDAALEEVGAPTAARSAITLEQFVSVVRKLDEAEEVDDDEEEEEEGEEGEDGDEELDLDFDGENLTPGENEEMLRILFETINGKKKTMPMKTFLAWDDVKDMQKEGVLDKETLDIFLDEVGVKKGAELTQDQFVALVTMLDENMRAVAGGAVDDDDAPGSALDEEGEDDDESSPEIDSEELEAVAREIYDELRGKSKSLSVKSFRKWEEVQEAVKAGILSENTLNVLVQEVASPGATELTFDEFKQLVGLLDQVADAALGATAEDSTNLKGQPSSSSSSSSKAAPKAKGKQQQAQDADEDDDDTVFEMDEEDLDEPTPEELEAFAREIFDELKSAKTNKVTIKAFKAWEGVKDVLESGELSKEDLASVIAEVDKDNTGSLSFDQFRKIMDKVEDILNEGADFEDDEEEEEEEEQKVAPPAKGKGKATAVTAAAAVSGQGFGRESGSESKKGKGKSGPPSPVAVEDEALEVATEIFNELRGKKKTLSVDTFKEWEDTRDLIESGALKRSTLEKAIVKVGAYESGEMTLTQFVALVDYIQASIDESSLSLGEFDEDGDGDAASKIPTSKSSKVLRLQDADEDDLGDDDEDWDGQGGEGEEELSEEEQAKQAFDDLRNGRASLPLVDFLKWEDVQELLECGALSKDNLATAIENAGLSVDKGEITFEKFYDLIQIIDQYVDQDKLPEGDDDEEFGEAADGDDEGEDEDDMDLSLGDGDDEGDYTDDAEVEEMFNDIAKGKKTITKAALYKWDELQELIDSGLCTKENVDTYVSRLNLKDGKTIDLEAFTQFIGYLDQVLVDGEGNIVE